MSAKKKMRMPGPARAGISLLILGAVLVGIGTTVIDRGSVSFYGLIMAITGFVLYMVSSIVAKRNYRR